MEETLKQAISSIFGSSGSADSTTVAAASLAPLFMSGGITVWLIANLKNIWSKFISALLSVVSFTVINQYEDSRGKGGYLYKKQKIFNKVISSSKTLWGRMAELDLSYASEQDTKKIIVPYGTSLQVILRKLVVCSRSLSSTGNQVMAVTTLRVFFARKSKWLEAFNGLLDKTIKDDDAMNHKRFEIAVHKSNPKTHEVFSLKHQKRSLDSIFSDGDVHKELFKKIKTFTESKEEYLKLDCPWKFCALLYGKPGCGKTSTILSIASALDRDVWYIDIKHATTSSLMSAMQSSEYFIFVFEDIDAACSVDPISSRKDSSTSQREAHSQEDDAHGLSLADLLNVTDGLLSGLGAICMFTTNHVEKLDPALIRPGRMNCMLEMKYLSSSTAEAMIKKQLGHKPNFKLADNICPAELQQDLLGIKLGSLNENEILKRYAVA